MIAGPGLDDLTGKVAVVTGAASGIGRGLATAYAREGMKVVLSDVEADALDATVSTLTGAGHDVIGVVCDVRERTQVEALRDATLDAYGAVHVVGNNAGVVMMKPVWEMTPEDWRWILGVNLDGVINGVSVFVPTLLEQGVPAHVVNTSSMAGFVAHAGLAGYTVSKRGVVGLSEVLALDLEAADAPIGVSVVCPGFVMTQLGNAERNRPAELGGSQDPAHDITDDTAEIDRVAGIVVDAIRTGRRYVFTHPERNEQIRGRFDQVLEQ